MTDSEFTILSFIEDGLNYSYIIEKLIEERRLRDYFELSFSSIYFLMGHLEEKKYIETYQSFGKKGVGKKGIKITELGKDALRKSIDERFSGKPLLSHPIDYILFNCHHTNSAELKAGINKYIREAERIYLFYQQREDELKDDKSASLGEKLVLSHFISKIKNEIEWAKEVRNNLQSIKNLDEILDEEKNKVSEHYRKLIIEE
ncbi:MAG: hypothetical protein A2086_16665 [Spirochaetes bacterium GWD1_27_9]|nr:MAG: hypothetical protein A2086_16665 [Spirochaetes bacterium GWD1_27_9]